jgi:hypothetical protein
MKRLLGILTVTVITTASQASTIQNGNVLYGKPTATAIQHQTATRNVPVIVSSPRIPKFKLLRGNPHRITHLIIDDWDDDFVDDEDIITPYRRRDLIKIKHPDDISESIRWRLFLARQLALLKYRNKFG